MTPPCPDNWQHCDHCGAKPNETCRNPDVNGTQPLRGTEGYDPGQHGSRPLTTRPTAIPGISEDVFKNGIVAPTFDAGVYESAAVTGSEPFEVSASVDTVSPVADRPAERPFIIGITGYKRSGKDTAAEVIAGILGYDRIAFAAPIKDMLRTLLRSQGLDEETIEEHIEGDSKDRPSGHLMGISPRLAMQTLGTEWGRETVNDNIWIETALRRAVVAEKGAVITDVRFVNEADAIREAGGIIVEIDRPEARPEMGVKIHASEADIHEIDADYTLANHSNRIAFQEKVAGWVWRNFLAKPA